MNKTFRQHPTPELYGFQSYVSMPIMLPDGRMFGTSVQQIDPRPAPRQHKPAVSIIGMFKLFAELVVSLHLDANARITSGEEARLVDNASLPNCESSSSRCSATTCAIRWRRNDCRRHPVAAQAT